MILVKTDHPYLRVGRHTYTTKSVARLFLDNAYKLHVLRASIVLDHDRIFTSHFWKELFNLAKVQLIMSSTYDLQSDGQTECVN
jgi:hypothetical protein